MGLTAIVGSLKTSSKGEWTLGLLTLSIQFRGKPRKGAEAIGEHLVVGRVVKESYGEKKQQHTFTVGILQRRWTLCLMFLFFIAWDPLYCFDTFSSYVLLM